MTASASVESVLHQVLADRFRVEGELGQGGMARVYHVTDLTNGRPLALKLLRSGVASQEEAVERLRREGEVLTRLKHPAVVGIETYGALPDGRLYLAMELLEGETLGQRMRRGPLDPGALCPVLTGAVAGLTAAHRAGIVHRDLKPDNIFLCKGKAGLAEQVKLLDFGISKVVDYERLTRTGQILGTPRYMAPEQLSADDDLGPSVDIYALGVILYEALAGRPPFVASSPSDLIVAVLHGKVVPLSSCRKDVAPELEAIILRAMARDPGARYATAQELAEAFVDVARPRSSGQVVRKGQRTKVVGSFAPGELPDAAPLSGDDDGSLRPGTFSGLVQPSVAADAASARDVAGAPAAPRSPGAPSHDRRRAGSRPSDAGSPDAGSLDAGGRDARRPSRPAARERPLEAGPRSHRPSHPSMDDSIELPMASSKPWLVVLALVAGGLSAALVLALLHFFFDAQP